MRILRNTGVVLCAAIMLACIIAIAPLWVVGIMARQISLRLTRGDEDADV